MVCQYSTRGLVSSGKHETTSEREWRARWRHLGGAIAAEVRGGYGPLLELPEVVSRAAKVAKTLTSRMPAKLYSCDTLLERLSQDLQDVAAARRPCIQEEHPVVREGHLARPRHVAPADPPRIRDGLVGRATRARRDQRRTVAGEAGDAVEPRRLDASCQEQHQQEGNKSVWPLIKGQVPLFGGHGA
jgi:hypothetical protein